MKKIKWFFLAILFVGVSSAFATLKPAKFDTHYYKGLDGLYREITDEESGFCDDGSNFCKYTLVGPVADQNDASYAGVPGTENQQWIP